LIQVIIRLLQTLLGLWLGARPQNAPAASPGAPETPPWLDWAQGHLGWRERGVNLGIEWLIKHAHCGSVGDPWCAIFVNAALESQGYSGTRSASARSFERDPDFVKLSGPALGAIVTMWRGSRTSGLGHVFFYTGNDANDNVWGIGGNEDDGVKDCPHNPSRITGYWWPRAYSLPTIGRIPHAGRGNLSTKET
jgi:uncharacterized protein (TIGR02594 family)